MPSTRPDFPISATRAPRCDRMAAWICLPVALWLGLVLLAAQTGCTASSQPTARARLGTPAPVAALHAALEGPGPIRFERVVAADWVVARSGLINLDHPRAREAGLEDGPEAIEIYLYVLEHPTEGIFFVDSGVASVFRDADRAPQVSPIVAAAMDTDALEVHVTSAEWIARRGRTPDGVFLTHIHLDHVMGLPDVPESVPVYVGPDETRARAFLNLFTRGTLDRLIAREASLREWPFGGVDASGAPAILDVFGDGSLFALHVPGHTPGSTAFVVRTTQGPKLLVGDTSHTAWGWAHGVEPGTFTADHAANARSLAWLRDLAAAHPALEVHLGHQRWPPAR